MRSWKMSPSVPNLPHLLKQGVSGGLPRSTAAFASPGPPTSSAGLCCHCGTEVFVRHITVKTKGPESPDQIQGAGGLRRKMRKRSMQYLAQWLTLSMFSS